MAVKDGLPATDFSRMNREYIKAVAEGGSGGGGLPEITEADEGKVLTVESGEAAWATAGGGGGGGSLYVININNTTHTLDKTFAEIYAAFLAGNILVTKLTYEATEEYGEEYVFYYITAVTRDFDLLGDGAGGVVSDMNQTTYTAAADTDYPQGIE